VSKSRIRWVEHVAYWREKKLTQDLVEKPEGHRPLGRPKHMIICHFTQGLCSKTPTKSENP
jgi:hypothetical protein